MTLSPISPRSPMMPVLDPEVRNKINAELQSGERLLWAAQPIPGLYARGAWPLMIFGLVFTGFSVFWIGGAGAMIWFSDDGPADDAGIGRIFNCFPLFGLPFFAVGMGLVTSPIWMRRAAKRSIYAVTDRRAIICQGRPWGGVEIRSFGPGDLTSMTRVELSNGAGDLVFRELLTESYDSKGHRTSNRKVIGFVAIEGVHDVENLVRTQLIGPYQAKMQNVEQP